MNSTLVARGGAVVSDLLLIDNGFLTTDLADGILVDTN
jgi:hypothetical protein